MCTRKKCDYCEVEENLDSLRKKKKLATNNWFLSDDLVLT